MAKRQTRRSVSVKRSTSGRIKRFTDDHKLTNSGFMEGLIGAQIGAASDSTSLVYGAEQTRLDQEKPKTRPEPDSSDTGKPPPHLQPKPEPKPKTEEELAEEMEDYVDPHTFF